ncbi:MAG: hypothetical protein V1837_01785 [Candidatus Woesearchaeota archaeon]
MQERLEDLRRQIRVMEWDQTKNQLNVNKVPYLNKLKDELTLLQQQEIPQEPNLPADKVI